MISKVLFSKESDHWSTPDWLYNYFIENGFVDPCPLHCKTNNLNKDFKGECLFINPPYSDIISWVNFGIKHITENPDTTVVFLVPSRTDTKWFHKLVDGEYNVCINFIKGRLKFGDSNNSAPFPSALIKISKYSDPTIFYERRFVTLNQRKNNLSYQEEVLGNDK